MTFIRYLIHTVFMGMEFVDRQLRGDISPYEPFNMWSFIKPSAKHIFDSEYNFLLHFQDRLSKILEGSDSPFSSLNLTTMTLMKEERKNFHIVSYSSYRLHDIEIFGTKGAFMYAILHYPIEIPGIIVNISEFFDGISLLNLVDNIDIFFSGGEASLSTKSDIMEDVHYNMENGFLFFMDRDILETPFQDIYK